MNPKLLEFRRGKAWSFDVGSLADMWRFKGAKKSAKAHHTKITILPQNDRSYAKKNAN